MNIGVLGLVGTPTQVSASLAHFNAQAPSYPGRARYILSRTTYWVYSPATQAFGPGKFVGLTDMTFETYEDALKGDVDDAVFNGTRTRFATQAALDAEFADRPELVSKLEAWGDALLGSDAFGNSNRDKWRFIELPTTLASRSPQMATVTGEF